MQLTARNMSDIGHPERVTQNWMIVVLAQQREKTRSLKQTIMQELLTGRIRLL